MMTANRPLLLLLSPFVLLLATTDAASVTSQTHPQHLRVASALEAVRHAYSQCLSEDSTPWLSCLKPKLLAYLSKVVDMDEIAVSRDLSLVRVENNEEDLRLDMDEENMAIDNEQLEAVRVVRRLERFLATHQLRARLPREISSGEVVPLLPQVMLDNMPQQVTVPLDEDNQGIQQQQNEGSLTEEPRGKKRGFIRRIVIPFLLGLKFKSTLLVPLALTLIALKTWKAMTLGLLSLVLTGAMLIFKLTKQKVVNYEVVHVPHSAIEHSDHVGYGRAAAHDLAYRGSRR